MKEWVCVDPPRTFIRCLARIGNNAHIGCFVARRVDCCVESIKRCTIPVVLYRNLLDECDEGDIDPNDGETMPVHGECDVRQRVRI